MVEAASTTWVGLALVVGPGGIGSAVAAELKRTCPDLKVLTAGRHGPPASSLQLDIENDSDLDGLSASLEAEGLPLRLVFNCSGRLHGPGLQPEKRLQQVDRSQLEQQFGINAMAPILLAKAIEPLLQRDQPFHFASLSARVGSIGDNRTGGWYGYRAAKAAQNQLLRCLSIEWGPPLAIGHREPVASRYDRHRPVSSFPELRGSGQTFLSRTGRASAG